MKLGNKLWHVERNTCRRSSQLRAASFFIADTLFVKRRIVPLPKVGTLRYLNALFRTIYFQKKQIPYIKFLDLRSLDCIQNANQVCKQRFHDTKFNLMKYVHYK